MNIDTILNPRTPSAKDTNAALAVILAIAEAIRALGEVPGGELYARLCDKMTISQYETIIGTLKNAGLVSESAHMLTWIGPELEVK